MGISVASTFNNWLVKYLTDFNRKATINREICQGHSQDFETVCPNLVILILIGIQYFSIGLTKYSDDNQKQEFYEKMQNDSNQYHSN